MKRSPLKRKPAVRKAIDRQASEAWAKAARQAGCAMCGAAHSQGHHILYQQKLRQAAWDLDLEYERLRWDRRNMLPLCERHHTAHHSAMHRIPLHVVVAGCPKVLQFARELNLLPWLERTYPS